MQILAIVILWQGDSISTPRTQGLCFVTTYKSISHVAIIMSPTKTYYIEGGGSNNQCLNHPLHAYIQTHTPLMLHYTTYNF